MTTDWFGSHDYRLLGIGGQHMALFLESVNKPLTKKSSEFFILILQVFLFIFTEWYISIYPYPDANVQDVKKTEDSMIFSKSCEYGLQAVLYIAQHPGKLIGLKEIAANLDVPAPYLSKILQILSKRRILTSVKGPGGGFKLNPQAQNPTLLDIVAAIEGMEIFDRCGIGLKACTDAQPCPIHERYKPFRDDIRKMLSEKTILQYGEELKKVGSTLVLRATL
jgi:Rrf2 family protein